MSSSADRARTAGCCSSSPPPSGTGKTTLVERLVQIAAQPAHVAVVHVAAGARRASATASTIISSAGAAFEAMIAARRVPRVGRRVRQPLRHVAPSIPSALLAVGPGRGAGDRRAGRAPGAARGVDHTSIFVLPPSFEILEQRLRGPQHRTARPAMQRRLAAARGRGGAATPTTTTSSSTTSSSRRVERLQEIIAGRAVADAPHAAAIAEQIIRDASSWSRPAMKAAMALIALGVTGGIGAYKAVEVARGLQKRGHDVVAVMTRSARRFVGPAHLRGDHATRGSSPTSGSRAPTPTSSTSRSPRRSTCCSWRRPRPTSSASSPTGSPTTSSRRSTWRPRRRC